jgi:serine/threonine-protein kinase
MDQTWINAWEQKGPLPFEYIKSWILQICDALIYLHNQNPPIIHRDIKPANIKISPTGQAMLVDFGIAKVFDAGSKTMSGAQAVTPGYSPPEQYGVGTTDIQSDIYALGATLYKLLTGRTPRQLSLWTQGENRYLLLQNLIRDPHRDQPGYRKVYESG